MTHRESEICVQSDSPLEPLSTHLHTSVSRGEGSVRSAAVTQNARWDVEAHVHPHPYLAAHVSMDVWSHGSQRRCPCQCLSLKRISVWMCVSPLKSLNSEISAGTTGQQRFLNSRFADGLVWSFCPLSTKTSPLG